MRENLEELLTKVELRQNDLEKLSQNLIKVENQLSLLFSASPDMIVFVNRDGEILRLSQSTGKILGYTNDEMIGKKVWEFIHPDDVQKTEIVWSSILEGNDIQFDRLNHFINRWKKKNGEYAKLAWRFSVHDFNHDNTVGVATDVTDFNFDNFFNTSLIQKAVALTRDGIIITEASSPEHNILYVNESFCRISGYSSKELVGQNRSILQGGDVDQEALNTMNKAFETGDGCDVLLKNLTKESVVYYNHLILSPILEGNHVINYIGISKDVTEMVDNNIYIWDRTSPRGFGRTPFRNLTRSNTAV